MLSTQNRLLHRSALSPLLALPVLLLMSTLAISPGCNQLRYRLANSPPKKFLPNPIQVTGGNDTFVWNQIVDTVDDFFRISRQQPVVSSDGIILDGRLETAYQIGGSIFEPWRKDSTAGFERLQGTLQSIRRRAIVTARPAIAGGSVNDPGGWSAADANAYAPGLSAVTVDGYVVEVVVTKDLEDVDRPQGTSGTSISQRHDGTLIRRDDRYDDSPVTLGWIPQGRDSQLEQRILNQIVGRLSTPDAK